MFQGNDLSGRRVTIRPRSKPRQAFQRFKQLTKKVGKKIQYARRQRLSKQAKRLKQQESVYKQRAANQTAKNNNQALVNRAKLENQRARAELNTAKLEADSSRGGIVGWNARRRQKIIAKNKAEVKMSEMEPELSAKERLTRLQTDAQVKRTKARGAAVATAVSALGGSIAAKSESDSRAKIAQAEADAEASRALVGSLRTVPTVTEDEYSNGSASGLITGVR